jgi:hypothetical protein
MNWSTDKDLNGVRLDGWGERDRHPGNQRLGAGSCAGSQWAIISIKRNKISHHSRSCRNQSGRRFQCSGQAGKAQLGVVVSLSRFGPGSSLRTWAKRQYRESGFRRRSAQAQAHEDQIGDGLWLGLDHGQRHHAPLICPGLSQHEAEPDSGLSVPLLPSPVSHVGVWVWCPMLIAAFYRGLLKAMGLLFPEDTDILAQENEEKREDGNEQLESMASIGGLGNADVP